MQAIEAPWAKVGGNDRQMRVPIHVTPGNPYIKAVQQLQHRRAGNITRVQHRVDALILETHCCMGDVLNVVVGIRD